MHLDIKDDAIFIADVHYNKKRVSFEKLLDDIFNQNIITSQIFFMGDMFDYLSDEINYFQTINKKIITKINVLSIKKEIIYLEGNHDYNLSKTFPYIKVIPRKQQPLICKYQDKKIALSHGDIFTPFFYNLYTAFIRNSYILKFINFIDLNDKITKKIESLLINKDICHNFKDFENFALKRINLYKIYDVDMIIEGHFHQGKIYQNYINIPSYACGQKYFNLSNIILQHSQHS